MRSCASLFRRRRAPTAPQIACTNPSISLYVMYANLLAIFRILVSAACLRSILYRFVSSPELSRIFRQSGPLCLISNNYPLLCLLRSLSLFGSVKAKGDHTPSVKEVMRI